MNKLRGIYFRKQPRGAHKPFTTFKRSYYPDSWWIERTLFLPLGFFVTICWLDPKVMSRWDNE